ncbi:MAG: ABC transporter permease, partial [Nocardioidaceae bacterium]
MNKQTEVLRESDADPTASGQAAALRGGQTRHADHRKVNTQELVNKYAMLGAWALIIIVFAVVEPHTFFTVRNFTSSIFGSQSVLVVLAFSLVVTLTAGDYDLSAGATLSLSAMVVAVLNSVHHVPIVLAVLAAIVAGAAMGAFNGFLVLRAGIDSLIATLATGTVAAGIVLWISDSQTIAGVSNTLIELVIVPRVGGLPLSFFYAVALAGVLWYFLKYTPVGRRLLFVGRGRKVSRLSGLRVDRLRWGALIAGGVLSALAGILYVGTSGSADPDSGTTFLLPAFAAAFLGSTSITPGRFNAWGTIAAVYFLGTGINGLSLMGIDVFVQDLFYGGALIV